MTSGFQRGYRVGVDHFIGEAAGQRVAQYGERVEASVEELIRDMLKVAVNQKDLHYAKGDVAELWHAGTINLDATQRGIDVTAFAPRDSSPIDVAMQGNGGGLAAQLKYYRSAEDTAKAISDPKYRGLDQKVVPGGQLEDVRNAAVRLASKNVERPEMASSHDHTARTADDRLRIDGAESRPLTEQEARNLTQQLRQSGDIDRKQFGLTPQQVIRWEEIAKESFSAAGRAALISAVLQSAPYLVTIAKKGIAEGEITVKDFAPLGRALPTVMLRSGLAGGLTAAIVGAAKKELLGATLKDIDPTFISAAVVLCLSAVENSIRAASGQITSIEAAARTAEDALTLTFALGFGAAGQALMPIPLIGALLGGIVGALVSRFVIDGANEAVLSITVETGWTFFGLVEQNYSVPIELLSEAGWRTVELKKLELQSVKLRALEPKSIDLETIDLTLVRQGVVAFRRVGYTA